MALKGLRVDMNSAGAIAALTDPGVQADIERRLEAAAASARGMNPDGEYEVSVRVGRTRVRGSVITANYSARKAEATDRVLLRALDAARG